MFLSRLLRLVLLIILVSWVVRLARRLMSPPAHPPAARGPGPRPGSATPPQQLHRDPVCGRFLPADIAVIERVGDEALHFCSPACRDRFLTEGAQPS